MSENEILDQVDEAGKVIGKAPRSVFHSNPDMIHPVAHCWFINNQGQILWQKRSKYKETSPGKWDMSVGGHILAGDLPEKTIEREALEELGLNDIKFKLIIKYLGPKLKQRELIYLYIAEVDKNINEFILQQEEVEMIEWIEPLKALQLIKKKERKVTRLIKRQIEMILDHLYPKQLRMILPIEDFMKSFDPSLPGGHKIRLYNEGDKTKFDELMKNAGWEDWDEKSLDEYIPRILPKCWFTVIEEKTGKIVATAMGLKDTADWDPKGGQFGWLACDPKHRGKGLGLAVTSRVINKMKKLGYESIHLGTEDYRLAAIKIYFKLGFVPYLHETSGSDKMAEPALGMKERWEKICTQIDWPLESLT